MNALHRYGTYAIFTLALSASSLGQETDVDRMKVPLSDPSRPAFLKASVLSGSITVKGYAGKEVIVEARRRDEESPKERRKEKGGLRLIPQRDTGLTAEEDDNTVTISTGWRSTSHPTDLSIQVPTNCSMKLSTVNDGDIEVEQVAGDIEVNNTNGAVRLSQISGSAVAHALNGELRVTFVKVDPQKNMSFSSLNGHIDVTFPSDIKATTMMKSEQGEIYSDFDIVLEKSSSKVEENPKGKKGKYRVSTDRGVRGTINGGGPEYQFKNFNGDIYIRKGK